MKLASAVTDYGTDMQKLKPGPAKRLAALIETIPHLREYTVERLVIMTRPHEEAAGLPRRLHLKHYHIMAVSGPAACRIADASKHAEEKNLGHHSTVRVP